MVEASRFACARPAHLPAGRCRNPAIRGVACCFPPNRPSSFAELYHSAFFFFLPFSLAFISLFRSFLADHSSVTRVILSVETVSRANVNV